MKVGLFAYLRMYILLRNISNSLKQLVVIQQTRLDMELTQQPKQKPEQPRKAIIGSASVEDLNKAWRGGV